MNAISHYRQFFRFGVIGVLHNAAGYLIYLAITSAGIDPKITITALYPIGFAISYIGNKKWAFSHTGNHSKAVFRFVITHIIGYMINLCLLFTLVDIYGYQHYYVQLIAIAVLALYFFIALKIYVFRETILEE